MKIGFVTVILFSLLFSRSAHGKTNLQPAAKLIKVASGFNQVTDAKFLPGSDSELLVVSQKGKIHLVRLAPKNKPQLLTTLKVKSLSEQGLLSIAFHPKFQDNRKLYLHYTPASVADDLGRIAEWHWPKKGPLKELRTILEVKQPAKNHNGGQIAFGKDGFLYASFGDGGGAGDIFFNGQKTSSILGSIVRIDVDRSTKQKPYSIPKDNPFVNNKKFRPEIYAYGARNVWKFSFLSNGKIIAADVGQYRYEEVNIVSSGDNLGWNTTEGKICFYPPVGCNKKNLIMPIAVIERAHGQSITGGYVATANKYKKKKGKSIFAKYIFGDFVSGRIWALDLQSKALATLLKTDLSISTFARSTSGTVYVGDYSKGDLYRLDY